jgi:hypothetical protein
MTVPIMVYVMSAVTDVFAKKDSVEKIVLLNPVLITAPA